MFELSATLILCTAALSLLVVRKDGTPSAAALSLVDLAARLAVGALVLIAVQFAFGWLPFVGGFLSSLVPNVGIGPVAGAGWCLFRGVVALGTGGGSGEPGTSPART